MTTYRQVTAGFEQVSLSAPNNVGVCDVAVLRAESASWPTATVIVWGCLNDPVLDNILRASVSVSAGLSESSVSINGSLLVTGFRYTMTVQILDLASGLWSDIAVAHLSLSSKSDPMPRLAMALPGPPLLRMQLPYTLVAGDAIPSKCSVTSYPLTLMWTITKADTGVVVALGEGTTMQLDQVALAAQQAYSIQFAALQLDGKNATILERMIIIGSSPAVAAGLDTGGRMVSWLQPVLLDVAASYDPDACQLSAVSDLAAPPRCKTGSSLGLSFKWTCRCEFSQVSAGWPCQYNNGSLVDFPGAPVVKIEPCDIACQPLNVLLVPGANTAVENLIIEVEISKKGASGAAASRNLRRLALSVTEPVQMVLEVSQQPLRLDAHVNVFAASVEGLGANESLWKWEVRPAPAGIVALSEASQAFSLSDVETFPAGNEGQYFVLVLSSAWAQRSISAGATYVVVLLAASNSNSRESEVEPIKVGEVWTELQRPAVPSGGTCVVTPTSGLALITTFEISCVGWVGQAPPLLYQFTTTSNGSAVSANGGLATAAAGGGVLTWSPAGPASAYDLILPPGDFMVYSMILDSAVSSREGYCIVYVISYLFQQFFSYFVGCSL